MSINLVDAAKSLFTNDLSNKAASYLGESESSVNKAIAGIVPSLLGGITEKASSPAGATTVLNVARESASPGFLGNVNNFFDNDGGSFLNKGEGLLSSLFGEHKTGSLSNLISNFSGVKSTSASSLLSMAAPLVMGLLGRHATTTNLDANGLSSFLQSQKSNIASAIPAGLNLDSFMGGLGSRTTENVSDASHAATHHVEDVKTGSEKNILLPLILLALLGAAAWYFTKDGCGRKDETHATSAGVHSDTVVEDASTTPASGIGQLDTATGDFIYDQGENITIDLPNNGGKLNVGKNSTEYKLVSFLNDNSAVIDTAKGNWFEFTNVRFNTGGSEITSTSLDQLRNLVAISKAYPNAQFKIGGYTDNTGNASANVTLSQKRAEAVSAKLKELGIANAAIESAKGYGQEWPLADNTAAEGRAQNRRVAVNVKSK